MKEQPELAAFRFSARNRWTKGTASASSIHEWYGAGADQVHVEERSAVWDMVSNTTPVDIGVTC
jgi:hypothetical protein